MRASHEVVLEELRGALGTLSERQRVVVVLRLLEGLDTKETAKALGWRTGTVKVHLHRALLAMRHTLDAGHTTPIGETHDSIRNHSSHSCSGGAEPIMDARRARR